VSPHKLPNVSPFVAAMIGLIGIVVGALISSMSQFMALQATLTHESRSFVLKERLDTLKDFAAASESGTAMIHRVFTKAQATVMAAKPTGTSIEDAMFKEVVPAFADQTLNLEIRRSVVAAQALFGAKTRAAISDCASCSGLHSGGAGPADMDSLIDAEEAKVNAAQRTGDMERTKNAIEAGFDKMDSFFTNRLNSEHGAVIAAMGSELWLGLEEFKPSGTEARIGAH